MSRKHHSDAEWRQQINTVAKLYLLDNYTTEDIVKYLNDNGFPTSFGSVKAKLSEWGIKKNQNDLGLMASRLLYERASGCHVTFERMGMGVPASQILSFIDASPLHSANNDPMPAYIQVMPQSSVSGAPQTGAEDMILNNEPASQADLMSTQQDFDNQQQRKKRKTVSPLRQTTLAERPSEKPPIHGSNEPRPDTLKDDDQRPTTYRESEDDRGATLQTQRDEAQVMEKAFSALEKLGSSDPKSKEALEHARKILKNALKTEEEDRLEKERTDFGPFHKAALKNSRRVAELLLTYHADFNAVGGLMLTPLHCAVIKGHPDFVKFLLQQPGIGLNATDRYGHTALHFAIEKPWVHCAMLLLQHGADIDIADEDGRTPLHWACREPGLLKHVELMLEMSPSTVNKKDNSLETPLWLALAGENDEYILPLLKAGADLNIPNKHGRTPFFQACFTASTKLLFELMDWKPDLSMKGAEGETPLHLLCQRGLHDVVERAVQDAKIDINALSRRGVTPLMLAVGCNDAKIVRILVENKADMSARDISSDTALCIAIDRGYTDIAEILIRSGSPTNPTGESMNKHESQLENAHRTQHQLFVLNSIEGQLKPAAAQAQLHHLHHHHYQQQHPSFLALQEQLDPVQARNAALMQQALNTMQTLCNQTMQMSGASTRKTATNNGTEMGLDAQFTFGSAPTTNSFFQPVATQYPFDYPVHDAWPPADIS